MNMLITGLLIAAVALPWAQGQFPKACINLQSLKNKECCPVPEGFSAPCGSDGNRGECQDLTVREWNSSYRYYQEFQKDDDRHNWPNVLFNRTCKCNANFGGYNCSKCEYGYYGDNCDQKKILKRRNFAKLADEENHRYLKYINMSRYVDSDYVVTTTTYHEIQQQIQDGRDPTSLFHNVNGYDLFVWMHYYASRETIHLDGHTDAGIDFAHEGPGCPTWHRLYMLAWERAIQELAEDEDFALPYWDWTESKDRIYEKWLRDYNKDASTLSTHNAPIGHNRGDVIVPLFPVYTHEQIFKKSFELSHDYEDVDQEGKSSDDLAVSSDLGQCPAVSASETDLEEAVAACAPWKIAAASLAGILCLLLLVILVIVFFYSCKPLPENAELQQLIPVKVDKN